MDKYIAPEYRIVTAQSLSEMSSIVTTMIDNGWQKISNVSWDEHGEAYIVEMYTEHTIDSKEDIDDYEFSKKYDKLSQRLKDFLEINDIELGVKDGVLYSRFGEDVVQGINPIEVANKLKNSRHVPLNLTDEDIILEIEGLI